MSKVNVPRHSGDDYQSRWFWFNVCRLFTEPSKVKSVVYEANEVKSFDDVAVFYKDGMRDSLGRPLYADFYQVKFHMRANGSITWQDLIDPKFINAHRFSLLQRLKNVQQRYAPDGTGYRFYLYTPWTMHPDDPLAALVSLTDGHIDLEKMFEGGKESKTGEIRAAWCEHLGLESDSSLYTILQTFHIRLGLTLDDLSWQLNISLVGAGLEPVDQDSLVHRYDELTRKLLQKGITEFDCEAIEKICKQEGLWRGRPVTEPVAYQIGIRSFLRQAEHLEDSTDTLLSLFDYFDGRNVKSTEFWNTYIFSEVSDFLSKSIIDRHRRYNIFLSAHSSIAFAAGYCLDTKVGVDVAPIQPTTSGYEIWRPNILSNSQEFLYLNPTEIRVNQGRDVVLAISITQEILEDVALYATQQLAQLSRIVSLSFTIKTGNRSVLSGDHAFALSQQIAQFVKTQRSEEERHGVLHIFSCAPNGVLFFLGQLARGFGSCILYEYSFESNVPGAYKPSISFNT